MLIFCYGQHIHLTSVFADIIGVADLLIADVEHHYAESAGQIGIFSDKKDIVDRFISQDGFTLYI